MQGKGDAGGPTMAMPDPPATARPKAAAAESASATLGLQALADSLDHATLNMSIAALDGARSAAAKADPARAADASKRLADQLVEQMKGLEAVLAEVNPLRR